MTAEADMPFFLRAVKRFRRIAFRLVSIIALGLMCVSTPRWTTGGLADIILADLGLVLLVVCAFGRIWSSIFIAGYKNDRLITEGPYSMVRNPLYVFSFCGALGVGLSAGSLTIAAVLILPFVIWFPIMVIEEERVLAERHGDAWKAYSAATPRFIPAFRVPTQPAEYTINTRPAGKAFLDAIWFPLAAIGIQAIGLLHQHNILPNLIQLW